MIGPDKEIIKTLLRKKTLFSAKGFKYACNIYNNGVLLLL